MPRFIKIHTHYQKILTRRNQEIARLTHQVEVLSGWWVEVANALPETPQDAEKLRAVAETIGWLTDTTRCF